MEKKPHKHAEVIKAWADGHDVQVRLLGGTWGNTVKPDFHPECIYRIKPEPPKYPKTRMTKVEIADAFDAEKIFIDALEGVANAAIAHAIEDGDLVISLEKKSNV